MNIQYMTCTLYYSGPHGLGLTVWSLQCGDARHNEILHLFVCICMYLTSREQYAPLLWTVCVVQITYVYVFLSQIHAQSESYMLGHVQVLCCTTFSKCLLQQGSGTARACTSREPILFWSGLLMWQPVATWKDACLLHAKVPLSCWLALIWQWFTR